MMSKLIHISARSQITLEASTKMGTTTLPLYNKRALLAPTQTARPVRAQQFGLVEPRVYIGHVAPVSYDTHEL